MPQQHLQTDASKRVQNLSIYLWSIHWIMPNNFESPIATYKCLFVDLFRKSAFYRKFKFLEEEARLKGIGGGCRRRKEGRRAEDKKGTTSGPPRCTGPSDRSSICHLQEYWILQRSPRMLFSNRGSNWHGWGLLCGKQINDELKEGLQRTSRSFQYNSQKSDAK